MTVGELMTPFLKLSNNMHAETLVKAMGAETTGSGSWSAGLAAVRSLPHRGGRRRGRHSGSSTARACPAR